MTTTTIIMLNALSKDTSSKLAGLFSTLTFQSWTSSTEAAKTNFLSLLAWLHTSLNPGLLTVRQMLKPLTMHQLKTPNITF